MPIAAPARNGVSMREDLWICRLQTLNGATQQSITRTIEPMECGWIGVAKALIVYWVSPVERFVLVSAFTKSTVSAPGRVACNKPLIDH